MAAQQADPDSTLSLYRNALRLRRELFGAPKMNWISEPDADVLVFERAGRDGRMIRCAINQGSTAVALPAQPVLASGPLTADELPGHDGLVDRLTYRCRRTKLDALTAPTPR